MARRSQGGASTGRQALIIDDGPIELGAPQIPSDGSAVAPPGDPLLPTDAAPALAKDDSVSESAQVIAKAVRYVKAKRGGDLAAVIPRPERPVNCNRGAALAAVILPRSAAPSDGICGAASSFGPSSIIRAWRHRRSRRTAQPSRRRVIRFCRRTQRPAARRLSRP